MDPSITHQPPPLVYNPFGAPMLPAGWVEHRAPTGQPYWYNTITHQSSWIFPLPPQQQPPKKKKQIKKKIPNTHWLFVITHDGYEFYYDRENKKSVWEMPEELKEPMELLKKMEEESKKREAEEAEERERTKRVKVEEEKVKEEEGQEKSTAEATDEATAEATADATEMTEDDIMWQLEQMGQDNEEVNEQENEVQPEKEQLQQEDAVEQEKNALAADKLKEEECIAQFNELLQEKITSPFAVYSVEYPKLMTDPRFSLVPNNKQKTLFNKHCSALGEKLKNEKENKKKPEDEFKELLWSKVTEKMYWDDFRRKYKDDPRFKALPSTREREAMFKDHVKHHLGKKKKSPREAYMELLRNTKEIRVGIRWRDAKRILENDDRYYAIESKLEREDLFRDYLDDLSKEK